MIDYINSHQAAFWALLGFVLFGIETFAFGLSVGVLLFAAVGALVTAGLIALGWLPATWEAGVASFGIATAVAAALLWRPLLRLQHNRRPPERDRSSDLIGYQFRLAAALDPATEGSTRYSGVSWRVRLDRQAAAVELPAGTLVTVTGVDAGIFWVAPSAKD